MKPMKKLLIGLLALTLLLGCTITALAAIDVKPGKSVSVSFTVKDVYTIDGYFEYSNKDLFKSVTYQINSKLIGSVSNDRLYAYDATGSSDPSDITITISGTVASNAKTGDKCDIKLTYETADSNGNMSEWKTMTKTVTVKEETKPTETTKPSKTTAQPTKPTETTPTHVEPDVDYTELKRQISIATSLDEYDFTADSWDRMAEALTKANELLTSKVQADVNDGAKALEDAITALVKLDFSELQKAMTKGREMIDTCAHGKLWYQLFDLLNEAETVKKSRDQAAIDDLAVKINNVVDQIMQDCPNCGETKIVEVVKEVTVTVPVEPNDPYCNIKMHKVWPILFFVTLGLLLIACGLILWFFMKKKKNEKDDTPLVDYDIADDDKTEK